MAVPTRAAARPKALDSVCSTTRRSYFFTKGAADFVAAKSTYASSTTRMHRDSLGLFSSCSTTLSGMDLAVGLPGEQMKTIFVRGVTAASTAATSTANVSATSGAATTATSCAAAQTLYMPYVGGVMTTLSSRGSQKRRKSRSMASSEPTPTNTFSASTPRNLATRSLRGIWYGHGYRCMSGVAESTTAPMAFSFASSSTPES
mmetsp:Transcript_8811/g.29057  ORF Transcript_8811/g.29057 Transcript_8811/m.29057 type:complete len:203 (+) Transcript_8811:475-1083(+)